MDAKQVKIGGVIYDLVTKKYVNDTADEKVGELRESVAEDLDTLREDLTVEYNTPYNAETNKVATMADIENALFIDEEELV